MLRILTMLSEMVQQIRGGKGKEALWRRLFRAPPISRSRLPAPWMIGVRRVGHEEVVDVVPAGLHGDRLPKGEHLMLWNDGAPYWVIGDTDARAPATMASFSEASSRPFAITMTATARFVLAGP